MSNEAGGIKPESEPVPAFWTFMFQEGGEMWARGPACVWRHREQGEQTGLGRGGDGIGVALPKLWAAATPWPGG